MPQRSGRETPRQPAAAILTVAAAAAISVRMTAVPQIFDRMLVATRLRRALAQGYESFLLDRMTDDALDRLAAVKRSFEQALDVGTPTPRFSEILRASGKAMHVARAALTPEDILVRTDGAAPAPQSFDLAASLLVLHAVNDLPGALAQIRRALKPDGLLLAGLLGGASLTELRQSLAAAEDEWSGGASPRVAPFADVRDMGALLQRAGFALPVTDVERVTVRYADMFALMRDLRRMGLANPLLERSRRSAPRAFFFRAAAIYAERFADADGRIRATFDMLWLSGWAPHESQQKPLKPGSARTRLADALRTPEISTGEKAGS